MALPKNNRLPRGARLKSTAAIDALFASGRSALSYPLRAVWLPTGEGGAKLFVSIPKRRVRHAVDRVACRRRVREAYRLQRRELLPEELNVNLGLIYVANGPTDYAKIFRAVGELLQRIADEKSAD